MKPSSGPGNIQKKSGPHQNLFLLKAAQVKTEVWLLITLKHPHQLTLQTPNQPHNLQAQGFLPIRGPQDDFFRDHSLEVTTQWSPWICVHCRLGELAENT